MRPAPLKDFIAEGPDFHDAFKATLEEAVSLGVDVDLARIARDFDPMFGVYKGANEMLLNGELDFVVSLLNPKLRRATFAIDDLEASEELEELPDHGLFRQLGRHLHDRLDKKSA